MSVQAGALDILSFAYVRWDPIHHRPQHLLSRAARDRRVFYVEEPVFEAGPSHLSMRRTVEGVIVVTPSLPLEVAPARIPELLRELVDQLIARQQITQFVLWLCSPLTLKFVKHLEPRAIVFDCAEDLTGMAGAPDELAAFEELTFIVADVVFTAGPSMFTAQRGRHSNVHDFPSGVDVAHFLEARRLSTRELSPPDQRAVAVPRVGYFGAIDRHLDLALIAGLADLRPDLGLVMIGPVAGNLQLTLPRRPNLRWLGVKTYDELPYYLAGWAVALLPYVCDGSLHMFNPPRMPEYLAAGRAVVATSLPDLVHPYQALGLVRVANTPETMSAAIDAARLETARDRNRRADRWLATVSWDRTWAAMNALIDDAIAVRRAGEPNRGLRAIRLPA